MTIFEYCARDFVPMEYRAAFAIWCKASDTTRLPFAEWRRLWVEFVKQLIIIDRKKAIREAAYTLALDLIDKLEPVSNTRGEQLTAHLRGPDGRLLTTLEEVVRAVGDFDASPKP